MEKSDESRPSNKLGFTLLIILAGAFFLRVWQLEIKPVHFDEGINGHFVASIWRNGFYHYDPTNFHGPLYFYLLQATELIFGFGIFGFRFMTGLLQIATLVLIAKHKRFVGKSATPATLIMAVSTAFVFYSRYSIHESLFILGQVAFSYGFFMYREEKSARSLWWMAMGIVTLVTTKETFFIFLGTWAIASLVVTLIDRYFPQVGTLDVRPNVPAPPAAEWFGVTLVSLLLIFALFTGFFMYPEGAVDFVRAFSVWAKTGLQQTGHEKPFLYWVDLFKKYEWPTLIALLASPFVFFWVKNRATRVLVLVGLGTWLAYSLIPYKTPWLVLNLIWPLAFSGGAILGRAFPSLQWRGLRTGFALALFVCIVISSREMWRLNFHDFARQGEPYVYVQTTNDFKHAVDAVYRLVEKHPEERNLKIAANNRDPWPLPYMLLPFTSVTWGRPSEQIIEAADVIFSDSSDRAFVESKIQGHYFVLPFQVRDSYQDGQAYLRVEKFRDILPSSSTVFASEDASKKVGQ